MIKNVARMSSLVLTGALILAACTPAAPKPEVASIVLTPDAPKITVGATQPFTAVAKDKDGKTISGVAFTYTSSDTSKATINGAGVATGVAVGTSKITAKAGSKTSNEVTLTVEASPVTSIEISAPSTSVEEGKTLAFTAVAKDKDNKVVDGVVLNWESSNTVSATVSGTGVVTGVAEGTAKITAKLAGVTSNAVDVTVTKKAVAPAYMGFEDNVEGWKFPDWNANSTGSVELSTLYATQGSKSLKVNSTGGGWFLVEFNPTRDFTGKTKVTFDLYAEGGETYYKTVVKSGTPNDGDWTESAAGSLTAPGANSITINLVELKLKDPKTVNTLGIYLNKGTYYIDNVQLL